MQMWVLVQASLVNAMERVFEVEWLKITLAIVTLDSRELIVNLVNKLYDSWYIYKILNNTMDRYIFTPLKTLKHIWIHRRLRSFTLSLKLNSYSYFKYFFNLNRSLMVKKTPYHITFFVYFDFHWSYMNIYCFTDTNECSADPCNFLFQCEDRINAYHCKLIGWKLALIVASSLILILLIYFSISFFLWIQNIFFKSISFCLFLWSFCPIRELFTHMETSLLTVNGCKFWPMLGTHGHWSVRFFLACNTYCDTGLLFIMVISEDPWHSHLLPSVWQWSCH